ncbi:MAG: hypothetical protein ABEJ93_04255 [Candidatus Nanohalobium sp.]
MNDQSLLEKGNDYGIRDLSYEDLGEYVHLLSFAAQESEAHLAGEVPEIVAEHVNDYLKEGLIDWTSEPEKVKRADPDADREFSLTQEGKRTIEDGVETNEGGEVRYSDIRAALRDD